MKPQRQENKLQSSIFDILVTLGGIIGKTSSTTGGFLKELGSEKYQTMPKNPKCIEATFLSFKCTYQPIFQLTLVFALGYNLDHKR